MSTIKGITDIFNSLTNLEKVKLTEQQLADKQNQRNIAQQAKVVAQERKDNLALTKDNLKNRREENETEINSLVQEIENWNIVAQDWSTIDDKFGKGTTEDGKEILNNLGIKYGENFKFKEKMSTNYREQLNNTTNLINFQDDVINDLSSKLNQITRLEEDWKKVGTDAANKGIKDVEDVLAYIESDTLGTDGSSRFLNEEGNPNYLGRAFMKIKETPTDTGFVDNAEIDAALSKITEEKEVAEGLDKKEFARDLDFSFEEISSTEDLLGKDDDMFKTMGGKIASYKGSKDLYEEEGNQKQLMQSVQSKIKKIFDYSNSSGIFGTSKAWRNSDIMKKINAMGNMSFENQKDLMGQIYDMIMPNPNKNEVLYGSNKIWSDSIMEEIDLASGFGKQKTQEDLLKQYLTVWGKLNNKLYPK